MDRSMGARGVMTLLGGLAGLALYGLYELQEAAILPALVVLALAGFAFAFFTGVLAMWGPLGVGRASAGAALIAAVSSGLLVLAATRYATAEDAIRQGSATGLYFVTALIPLPFWVAVSQTGWRDYPVLFTQAWGIFMRYVSAFFFVLIVWGLILLSDALLNIVGIHAIERLIDTQVSWWVISGATLGLAIAIANELSEVVSPLIVLRLLRVLLPLVLAVMVVFIVALPLQGLSGLFGGFSAAMTLLSMCVAAATLVTAAIDRRDEDAVRIPLMTWAARVLAAILAVPAGLALWAVMVRIGTYGWTPSRLYGATAAAIALAYGAAYLLAVLRGTGWMAHIRRANTVLAVLIVAVAALWQTPLLDAERISANSQLERIVSGRTTGPDTDIQAFAEWGRSGERALAELDRFAAESGNEAFAARLDALRRGESPVTTDDLASVMPVRPADATTLRDRFIAGMERDEVGFLHRRCITACVMVIGPFDPADPDPQAIVISSYGDNYPYLEGFVLNGDVVTRRTVVQLSDSIAAREMIASLLDESPEFSPSPQNWIEIPGGALTLGR